MLSPELQAQSTRPESSTAPHQHQAASGLGEIASSTLSCIPFQSFFRCPSTQCTCEILVQTFYFHTAVLMEESTKINKMAPESSWYISYILVQAKPGSGPTVDCLGQNLNRKEEIKKHIVQISHQELRSPLRQEGLPFPSYVCEW